MEPVDVDVDEGNCNTDHDGEKEGDKDPMVRKVEKEEAELYKFKHYMPHVKTREQPIYIKCCVLQNQQ